jgi:hypothetical protein
MLEEGFRKIHRTVGIYLAGFLALQALTGLFISLGTMASTSRDTWWFWLAAGMHHDWNPLGNLYRIILAVVTLAQGAGGVLIYLMIRARQRTPETGPQS